MVCYILSVPTLIVKLISNLCIAKAIPTTIIISQYNIGNEFIYICWLFHHLTIFSIIVIPRRCKRGVSTVFQIPVADATATERS